MHRGSHVALMIVSMVFAVGCEPPVATERETGEELIDVMFTERTPLDEPANHLTLLFPEPREELVLPEAAMTGETWFFDVYYTRTGQEDFTVSAAVVSGEHADTIYVDRNNDEDLTDDGPPIVLGHDDESLSFDIAGFEDARQRTSYLLQRSPVSLSEEQRAEMIDVFLDQNGDLRPEPAARFARGRSGFSTKAGRFFFDRRVTLARGEISVGEEKVAIGIFDSDNNGLFDDPDDMVVVDLDGDGRLTSFMSVEPHAVEDPILIGDTWVQLHEAERFGEGATFVVVPPPTETVYWLASEINHPRVEHVREGAVHPDLWSAELESTDGEMLHLADYRGEFVLLNFWGEWCGPCVAELPALVAGARRYETAGLRIIGLLESKAPARALDLLAAQEADWPQVMLTPELKKRFRIGAFPTNMLILPDGETYVRTIVVDEEFFESFITKNDG